MRFVKTQKHSISSVTTKGHYTNSRGKVTHHKRKSETPVTFVGIDGEGMDVNGEHRYVLLGVGENQIERASGLSWDVVFTFLYQHYKPGTSYVGFFLGYDFSQIFKTLPEDKAWMLLTTEGRLLRKHRIPGKAPHPVQLEGWQFDILGNKRLRIRPKTCDCVNATCKCKHQPWMYVCDAGSFFQTSFLKVINPADWAPGTAVITDEEYKEIKRGKEKRSTAVLDEDMRKYNRLENVVLSRVMHTLDLGMHEIGIHLPPSKWFGPGQAAQAWLKSVGAPKSTQIAEVAPTWFSEAARMSYFGGWFEIMMHGIVPGVSHEYDINSAYPHIISTLPCLLHGKYTLGEGIPQTKKGDLCLVYAKVWSPAMPMGGNSQPIGAMLHRDPQGRILRPMATMGWYWWDELVAAQSAGLIKRIDNRGKQQVISWVKYTPCDCPPPMREIAELYQKRLEVGKKSPLGKAAKLIYNSSYGKFAQSIGEPIFGNPIYASRITSGCRTMILNAIASHPKGQSDVCMVATDAVYFLSPHPRLTLGSEIGVWDHTERHDITLFKPGVYWDTQAREAIREGRNPNFKARGFNSADFTSSIGRVDEQFRSWDELAEVSAESIAAIGGWPSVRFSPNFSMTTALQALRQNDWERAGRVSSGKELIQNSDPHDKREGIYREQYNGRTVYRSRPYQGMGQDGWIPSNPYTKQFGLDDPWSEEYKGQYGETEDGPIVDILAWILTGE